MGFALIKIVVLFKNKLDEVQQKDFYNVELKQTDLGFVSKGL